MASSLDPKTLLEIVKAGVAAPSADNHHRFRCVAGDETIDLWADDEYRLTKERHRRILGRISFGAVVENMALRAAELGFGCRIEWSMDEAASSRIARLHLEASTSVPVDELATAIQARHTNRRMYRGPAPTNVERSAIESDVQVRGGARLVWLQGDARRQALKLIWMAESERFLRRPLHEEMFSSIRFDLPWDTTAIEALPPGSLEVERPMRAMFKALRHWPLMRAANLVGAHRMLGLRAGLLPCWQAPALGILVTPLGLNDGSVAVGQAFQRLWLRTTLLGLALQPMAASVVLPLQQSDAEGASAKLRSALNDGWNAIVPGETPLMVFRLGRAAAPAVRAGRLEPSHFLVEGSTSHCPS